MFDFDYEKLNAYFQERYDSHLSNYHKYHDELFYIMDPDGVYHGVIMLSSCLHELISLCLASPQTLADWCIKFSDLKNTVDAFATTVLFLKIKCICMIYF